jgi:hypothetical protein
MLIDEVLGTPGTDWSKSELAKKAGVVRHGGVDEHVVGFARLGLLVPTPDGRWQVPMPQTELARSLSRVSKALRSASSAPATAAPTAAPRHGHPALPAIRQALTLARREEEMIDAATHRAVLELLQAAEQALAANADGRD